MSDPTDAPRSTSPTGAPNFTGVFYNWLSLFGVAVLALALSLAMVLGLVDLFASTDNAYIGVAYLLIAMTGGLGLLVTLLGAARVGWRRRRGLPTLGPVTLQVDLRERRDRILAFAGLTGAMALLSTVGTGAYQGVHYMESDAFCTGACHVPMRPEAMAHLNSPHAKVACVACHVGEGAGSFVEAKLRGVRQLVGVITGDYDRPIPTPIHSMRPARETCENCHWRERWVGYQDKVHTYYSGEPDNHMSTLRLLVKVGGKQRGRMTGEGIHYHMSVGRSVEFAAEDPGRQEVTWVRVTQPDGSTEVFSKGDATPPPPEKIRTMDCIDCHNRPAHRFATPMDAMNLYLEGGRIDPKLPSIKRKGVEVLSAEYPDTPTAKERIAWTLRDFYDKAEPRPAGAAVQQAIDAVEEIYTTNFFPEMGVRWSKYPDNIGHKDSAGCFRCHNDSLVNAAGEAIFTTCTKCHVVLAQDTGQPGAAAQSAAPVDFKVGVPFFHSADEETLDEFTNCTLCHSGGADIY